MDLENITIKAPCSVKFKGGVFVDSIYMHRQCGQKKHFNDFLSTV